MYNITNFKTDSLGTHFSLNPQLQAYETGQHFTAA